LVNGPGLPRPHRQSAPCFLIEIAGTRPAVTLAAARHSNPITGGGSQLRFVSEAGLDEAAEAFCAVACFNSALLERATAERGAILAW